MYNGKYFYIFYINSTIQNPNAGAHYSKEVRKHPMHSGDLPPVIAQEGYSFMSFYLPQLTIEEVLNRSIIVHRKPDDFNTQPSGNSGEKIGCGVIRAV